MMGSRSGSILSDFSKLGRRAAGSVTVAGGIAYLIGHPS